MAEVIDFSKHREYSKAQKDDVRKLKNYVDSIYKDYYNLSDNDKILKKEFDKIYLKIMNNNWISEKNLDKFLKDIQYFLDNLVMFDENLYDMYPIIIYTVLVDTLKLKYLDLDIEVKDAIMRSVYNSGISYSFYKKAGQIILNEEVITRIKNLIEKDLDNYRILESILSDADYSFSKNPDVSDAVNLLDGFNKKDDIEDERLISKEEFTIDDVYNLCLEQINLLMEFSDAFFTKKDIKKLEKIKLLKTAGSFLQMEFINFVKIINNSNNINLIDKIRKIVDLIDIFVVRDNKVIEVDFKKR